MTVDQIPQYANLLKQLLLFQGFNDAQIAHVVTRFRPIRFEAEKLVFAQGTPGENFYIVFEGKVQVVRQEHEKERLLGILGIGEYFGEEALLFNTPRSATIMTLEPTELLMLDRAGFERLMQEYPNLHHSLSVTAESRHVAQKSSFDWLGDEEVVYLVTRRHELFLFTSLLLPLIIGIASIPLLAYGISTQGATFIQKAAAFLGLAGVVIAIVWAVWRGIDWGNDYYIITNQRVLWLEKVVFLYNSRREAPLTQILAVNVSKTWFGRVLGYGDVDVRTFTGGIRMRKSAKPDLFAFYVEGFKARANFLLRQAEIENIRRALRERMGLPAENGVPPPLLMRSGFRTRQRNSIKPGSLRDMLDTLFKVRYEQGNVITYRKHWLLLLGKTWIPSLLMLMLSAFAVYQMRNYVLGIPGFFATWPMFLLYALAFLGLFAWWIYNYLDWSNDIYQLSPEQIRDIERKPLGDELKKTAPLESILSLEHTRDGIIQLVFNYGNVLINVGETRFIFRGVYNPDGVHQDVSDYIEALSRHKRDIELARERERMLNWLITYKDQADILRELEREADWDLFSS